VENTGGRGLDGDGAVEAGVRGRDTPLHCPRPLRRDDLVIAMRVRTRASWAAVYSKPAGCGARGAADRDPHAARLLRCASSPGTRLGTYDITGSLEAEDGRGLSCRISAWAELAVKVLPEAVASSPDRLLGSSARPEDCRRDHPSIVTSIHREEDGVPFLTWS